MDITALKCKQVSKQKRKKKMQQEQQYTCSKFNIILHFYAGFSTLNIQNKTKFTFLISNDFYLSKF